MEPRITIIGLGVNDLKESTDFYTNIFGWPLTENSNESISFFKLNGFLLSLYPKDALAEDAGLDSAGSGFRSFTLAYNLRSEQEVDHTIQSLRKKGVKIIKEPHKVFWGGYSSYVQDPDGVLWEIAYNPFLPLDHKGNV